MRKFLLICSILLTACSSNPEVTDSETSEQEQAQQQASKSIAAKISAELTPAAPQAEDVLFANLLMIDGQWQIQSIGSQRKPVDRLKGEERLYILADSKTIMPDYDHHQFSDEDKRLFTCGQDIKYNKHSSYNPCDSRFMKNTKFGEGWFGWTRQFDLDEVKNAVQQTELLDRAKKEIQLVRQDRLRCQQLRKQAEQVAANQKLKLRVLDETGMYQQGHELVKYDLKVKPHVASEGCEQELENIKMSYELGLVKKVELALELRGKNDWQQESENLLHFERAIAEADKQLIPTLHITGKKVDHYNLYQKWSNDDIEFSWNMLDITETDLHQYFDIHNRGDQKISVQSVTFIINQHSTTFLSKYMLKPGRSLTGLEHASRYFLLSKKQREGIEAIKTINSGDELAQFGIVIRYKVGKENREYRTTKDLKLTSIL